MMQRVKQFYMAITCKITDDDKIFIKEYLNKGEIEIFKKLTISDQCHSIRVAMDIKQYLDDGDKYIDCAIDRKNLIKVALLHDIGKIKCPLNVFEKSTLVLLNKFTNGKLRRLQKIRKVNVYYNHANIGEKLLNKRQYSERFLYLVKNHHNNDIIGDKELDILKECDDRN